MFDDVPMGGVTAADAASAASIHPFETYEDLGPEQKAAFHQLSSYRSRRRVRATERNLRKRSLGLRIFTEEEIERYTEVTLIYDSNDFGVESLYQGEPVPLDMSCVYFTASRFNHSCDPNLEWQTWVESPWFTARASRKISAGNELTVSYLGGPMSRAQRQRDLKSGWGFDCACTRCTAAPVDYDTRLEEIVGTQRHAASQTQQGAPVWPPTEDETAPRHARRLQLLEVLQWHGDLHFAYFTAAHFHFERYQALLGSDRAKAMENLRQAVIYQRKSWESGKTAFFAQDPLVAQAGSQLTKWGAVLASEEA
ncbi:Uu.00g028930.m01.CDS01 [Anthostomella pinea]|uniref:Uu.00g028930.m01.CDS01 n=1 Tax=Anthostomella pinea TaxID=933095 RepID=A0AAI8YCT3_9PEZI|nr:Uu.00g028930.m01.CDS01 [Anthostomella pinea]